jgi:hypothetical protein
MGRRMSATDEDRFRITTWPGVVVPVPPVTKLEVEAKGDYFVYARTVTKSPLPEELAIRGLLAVDWQDRESVAAFVREHGAISYTAQKSKLLVDVNEPQRPPGAKGVYWGHVAAHLWQAQLLASHVLAHLEGEYVHPVWEQFGLANRQPKKRPARQREAEEQLAWGNFQQALNLGLEWYHARVELVIAFPTFDPMPMSGIAPIGLYSGLCMQILNLLTEGIPSNQCANTKCGQRFIRQQGRAEAGQYRTTGVDYCSLRCARNQMQRNYRNRKLKVTK